MVIRESKSGDLAEITQVYVSAFGAVEGSAIAKLVADIMQQEKPNVWLSLVAIEQNHIVGHILFSRVYLAGHEQTSGYILAPLAVAEDSQKQGVGSALIQTGFAKLKEKQADYVLVLGDPKYYSRVGFHRRHAIEAPYELPYPEAWLATEFKTGQLASISGVITCAAALLAPEHW